MILGVGRAGRWEGSMRERLCCPVDVYMLLEREGRVLMLRRAAGAAYAPLLLCPPSGHVEAGEEVAHAAIRETAEESGIELRRGEVRWVAVVQHRAPGGDMRIGWFFAAAPGWAGEPVNREPAKHSELVWVDPAAPAGDLVAYTWAGLAAWRAGAPWAIHLAAARQPGALRPGPGAGTDLVQATGIRPSLVMRAVIHWIRPAVVRPGGMSVTRWPTVAHMERTTRSAAGCRSSTLAR
jgi:8-oxo-dGTP diphosphatase